MRSCHMFDVDLIVNTLAVSSMSFEAFCSLLLINTTVKTVKKTVNLERREIALGKASRLRTCRSQ
jgi:hypothetical protein